MEIKPHKPLIYPFSQKRVIVLIKKDLLHFGQLDYESASLFSL